MSNIATIFQLVKDDFCSLWSHKVHGNTLEVITPYGTTNDKFISVFIRQQNDEFVVTDGGWLHDGSYDAVLDIEDSSFNRLFQYYTEHYNIRKVEQRESIFYYKKVNQASLISNLVFEMSSFLAAVVSASHVQFQDAKEVAETKQFAKLASDYIHSVAPKQNVRKERYIDEKYKSVRFGAIIENRNRFTLINYITGSNVNYFTGSLAKAAVNFNIITASPYSNHIEKKVSIINNQAGGYKRDEISAQIDYLSKVGDSVVLWSEKEKIKPFIAA